MGIHCTILSAFLGVLKLFRIKYWKVIKAFDIGKIPFGGFGGGHLKKIRCFPSEQLKVRNNKTINGTANQDNVHNAL